MLLDTLHTTRRGEPVRRGYRGASSQERSKIPTWLTVSPAYKLYLTPVKTSFRVCCLYSYLFHVEEGRLVCWTRLSLAADIWSLGVLLLHLLPTQGDQRPAPSLPTAFILSKGGLDTSTPKKCLSFLTNKKKNLWTTQVIWSGLEQLW
jgi:hypothetical protein